MNVFIMFPLSDKRKKYSTAKHSLRIYGVTGHGLGEQACAGPISSRMSSLE
jgi:hypothetical protein